MSATGAYLRGGTAADHSDLVWSPPYKVPRQKACPIAATTMLAVLLATCVDRLASPQRNALKAFFDADPNWPMVSLCSGSESPSLCTDIFSSVLGEKLSCHPQFVTIATAESKSRKRKFIMKAFPNHSICFGDVWDMSKKKAWNFKSDPPGYVVVPCGSRIAFGGFPCTDVSSLHSASGSSEHRSCMINGSLNTGNCFHGIVAWLQSPNGQLNEILILENVVGLADKDKDTGISNLQVLVDIFTRQLTSPYFVFVVCLCPTMFGYPEHRHRLSGITATTVHQPYVKVAIMPHVTW